MEKKYKSDLVLRPFTFGCGFAAFFVSFLILLNIEKYSIWPSDVNFGFVVQNLVGMIITALTMIVAVRPDDPIPWRFLTLFGLGFLIVFFCPFPLIGALQIVVTIFAMLFGRKKVKDSAV